MDKRAYRMALAVCLMAIAAPAAATVSFGQQTVTVSTYNEIGGFAVPFPDLVQQSLDASAPSGTVYTVAGNGVSVTSEATATNPSINIPAALISATASTNSTIGGLSDPAIPVAGSGSAAVGAVALTGLDSVATLFASGYVQSLQALSASNFARSGNMALMQQYFTLSAATQLNFLHAVPADAGVSTSVSVWYQDLSANPTVMIETSPGVFQIRISPLIGRNSAGASIGAFAAELGPGNYFVEVRQTLNNRLSGPGTSTANLTAESRLDLSFSEPVPEPEAWLMMILGFGLVGAGARRQRQGARLTMLMPRLLQER